MDDDINMTSENAPLLSEDINVSESFSSTGGMDFMRRQHKVQRDMKNLELAAVFVVAFDTKHGNTLEWCKPEYMREQLTGLEFKAMPSGAHTQNTDFVYIKEDELYGVACFEKISVDTSGERGVRMKSVGILCQSYQLLHIHKEQLSTLVKRILIQPGEYKMLEDYYQRWTGDILSNNALFLKSVNTHCPDIWYEQFISSFQQSLFIIWKAIMLRKRILFYCPPPAGHICQWVYCTTFLKSLGESKSLDMCVPMFFVNVADCTSLANQMSYVACTTEKVFECKTNMFDVYVDHTEVRVVNKRLKQALAPTAGDLLRLKILQSVRSPISLDEPPRTVEDNFYSFFYELNTSIMDSLHQSSCDERPISRKDLLKMGLHSSDRRFLQELIEHLGYEISVQQNICPCLPC